MRFASLGHSPSWWMMHGLSSALVEERLPSGIQAMICFYSVRPAQISPQAQHCCLPVAPRCPNPRGRGRSDTPCAHPRFDALTHRSCGPREERGRRRSGSARGRRARRPESAGRNFCKHVNFRSISSNSTFECSKLPLLLPFYSLPIVNNRSERKQTKIRISNQIIKWECEFFL